ncbi:hypothetical protein PT974_10974 [Cladobotryum mycophilum]|uniref:Uncharacterized protein n=1 Tax=Cladobotryum mycophilum TaxID=491253 RepID=A0ABR0SBC2_9HYPO
MWSTTTGKCLKKFPAQTPPVYAGLLNATFDRWGFHSLAFAPNSNTTISTDLGDINLDQFEPGQQEEDSKREVTYQGYGIWGDWIAKDGQPIIWLPPDYRIWREKFAIAKSQIAMACKTGHLLLINFSSDESSFKFT